MIQCHWTRTVGPTVEPLTLAEAKQYAVVTQDDDNALVSALVRAAREGAETYLGRALYTQTWKYTQSAWSDVMWLPMAAPLQSVSTVQYYATDGTLTTLSSTYYTVDTTSEPGRLLRAANQSWPALQTDRSGPLVIVTYVCGYTSVASIPEIIKLALRIAVAQADADRIGESTSKTVESILSAAGCVYWREPQECGPWR